jgi:hypothetical protein
MSVKHKLKPNKAKKHVHCDVCGKRHPQTRYAGFKCPGFNLRKNAGRASSHHHIADELLASIRVGDRVTIETPQGQTRSGRAVMRGPSGWVLNMGGPHGTPGVATHRNIVKVTRRRR